jgi:hypothetical protein
MAEEGGGANNNNVFIYRGGDEVVPREATHVIVDPSVDTITRRAFQNRRGRVSIDAHDGVEIIEEEAFMDFTQLESITLPGVRVIGRMAFFSEESSSLRNITLPKVEVIGPSAFIGCYQLTEVEFSEDLQSVGNLAFCDCIRLRRIAIPLKDDLLMTVRSVDAEIYHRLILLGGSTKLSPHCF